MKKIIFTLLVLVSAIAFSAPQDLINLASSMDNEIRNLSYLSSNPWQNQAQIRDSLNRLRGMMDYYDREFNSLLIPSTPPVQPHHQVSASCTLDVGGNFFLPKSAINCDIYGRGALGYEILVDGRLVWKGQLDGRLEQQTLNTDKQVVGGYAVTYDIFVFTEHEGKVLVKSFPKVGSSN